MNALLGLWRKPMQERDPDFSIRNAVSCLLTLSTALNTAVLATLHSLHLWLYCCLDGFSLSYLLS